MFARNPRKDLDPSRKLRGPRPAPSFVEVLENRQLLSASVVHHGHASVAHSTTARHALRHHKNSATNASSNTSSSTSAGTVTETTGRTIQFSQAPTAVQTGLDSLASTDGLAAPTSTQTVYLGNRNGIESYTLDYSSTGTNTRITVDQNGTPVTAPTETTTTWATLNGTGTGSNAAAAAEITKIATALGLTAPTDTTTVNVSTPASGTPTYSVSLSPSSTTTPTTTSDGDRFERETTISVDANGNPVGRQNIPFSALPTAIQNGINGNLPTGATALDATSTQIVNVRTENGVTTYSTTFTTTGTSTTVTVDATGALANLPSETTSTFSAIPQSAQTELQTLATADGAGTIATTQSVRVLDEANGTTIYTVSLSATDSTTSQTITVTLSVDQNGNPTVPPGEGFGGGDCGGGGGFGEGRGFGDHGGFGDNGQDTGSTSSTTSTTTV